MASLFRINFVQDYLSYLLFQDPKSTLGRETTSQRANLSCSSDKSNKAKGDQGTYEMNVNDSFIKQDIANECESKVDLGAHQTADGGETRRRVISSKPSEDKLPAGILSSNENDGEKFN